MPANSAARLSIENVIGIVELGEMILGHLDNPEDIRNVALTNKLFNRAAESQLWRAVNLRYPKSSSAALPDQSRSDERYSYALQHHTRTLNVDIRTMAPALYGKILGNSWEARGYGLGCVDAIRQEIKTMAPALYSKTLSNSWEARGEVDAIRHEIKEDVGELFAEVSKTLAQTPRLSHFTAVDVPRVLDLMILLQRHRPEIESINLAASVNDNMGLIALPTFDKELFLRQLQEDPGLIVPLANRVNLCADLELEPVFDFPRLRSLSLTGLNSNGSYPEGMYDPDLDPWTYDSYLAPLVSILMAAPNLTYLELSSRTCTGRLTSSGDFEPNRDQYRMPTLLFLCIQYKCAGGKPLRLKTLKLGRNCYLTMPIGPQHYLDNLTNLELLEDLRLEYDVSENHVRDRTLCHDAFVSLFVRDGHPLPSLRHLTWPWMGGQLLIPLMVAARSGRLARVALNCFDTEGGKFSSSPLPSSSSPGSSWWLPDTPEF
jgi:hypothetical protein